MIIITGTPGTGKTTLAKALAKKLKYKYIDVSKLIKQKKLAEGYDKKRQSSIVDTKKLNKELIKIIKQSKNKDLIIDSHLSHYLPKKYADLCIVTRCSLKDLEKRLNSRKYKKEKIRENLDAEIFDICYTEAKQAGHNILVIDTTKKPDLNKIIKLVRKQK